MAFFQAVQLVAPAQALMTADGANDLVPIFGDYTIVAGNAAGDIIEMSGIPTGYVPVDATLALEALAATATVDVGVLTGNYGALLDVAGAARTMGNEFIASGAGAAAGILRMNKKDGALIAPYSGDPTTSPRTTGDRSVGVKLVTFVTPTVGAKMRLTVFCRPAIAGV